MMCPRLVFVNVQVIVSPASSSRLPAVSVSPIELTQTVLVRSQPATGVSATE